ncbi:MAG: helix-turn-helix domain-containing protein [Anaerolineae bacterium]|nr:helix-turn-helix domain-containing protein [Anaerolineae bacterium]
MNDLDDLISLSEAAKQAGVARNTMHLAAKGGHIKATRIGRHWYIYASDIERWKRENYRPDMAKIRRSRKRSDQSDY